MESGIAPKDITVAPPSTTLQQTATMPYAYVDDHQDQDQDTGVVGDDAPAVSMITETFIDRTLDAAEDAIANAADGLDDVESQ